MEVLVTGATGFLGGALAARLIARGDGVRVLARPRSDLTALRHLPVVVHRGGLDEADVVRGAVEGAQIIYHCAGLCTDWGAVRDFESANVRGLGTLLDLAGRAGSVRRFLHVSTTDVYGYPRVPCDESAPLKDVGLPYNSSKVRGEQRAWVAHREGRLAVTVVRPATIYGPRSRTLVLEAARLLETGGAATVRGGRAHAGLLYVDNACEALIAAATSEATIGRAYNLRDDHDLSWREFLNALAAGLGLRPPWLDLPESAALAAAAACEVVHRVFKRSGRPVLTRHAVYLLSRTQGHPIGRAKQDFGFRSAVSFHEGIARSIEWARKELNPL